MASRDDYINQVTLGERTPHNAGIHLAEYDARWPALFNAEAEHLRAALGQKALRIEHVGSTAVPGLCAKPIIDMLLLVEDAADELAYLRDMQAAGYVLRIREPDWFGHRMFKGPQTDINLHVFSAGCPEVERMLRFRNRLRAHPEDRARYAAAKRQLARRRWRYIQEYADAKTAVVQDILKRAGE